MLNFKNEMVVLKFDYSKLKYTQILIMKVYRRFIKVLFFVCMYCGVSIGQNFDAISIPFEVDGVNLQNPLIGGLVAPQFASFDLDGEGAEDLLVFERNGGALLPFINLSTPGNPNYIYAPEYTSNFPELIKFVRFVDFNNDGKKDIFSLSKAASAIEVWRNTSSNDEISFELMKFNFGLGDFIQVLSGGNFTNLYVSTIDIPAIIDTDDDGDLDILTFEPGGSYMYHYQNMVKELELPDDTLVYKASDLCWGKFFESGVDEAISLSDDRSKCAFNFSGSGSNGSERHAGSTVTAFDGDGDGDLDMLLGDISNTGLVYLENDQIGDNAFIVGQDINYPAYDVEANITIFLSSFFIDIDNDGKRDLIVCPNNELGSDNLNHIWYYNNRGEDNAPIFHLEQKDFLLNTTLRMGHSSHPCFLDYNQDGLQDILVGMNQIYQNGEATSISLYLYENVGTISEPSYKLVDDDYLGLASDLSPVTGFLAPAVGDLDGDADMDIVISDNRTFLFYFENKAGTGQPFSFDGYVYEYKNLRVGTNGKPAIIDLDEDGLSDLVVGERNDNGNPSTDEVGGLNFFKNVGSIGAPDFMEDEEVFPNTNILGQVFTRTISDTSGESAPYFFKSEDKLMLAVGSRGGNIYVYDDIPGNLYSAFNQVYSELPIFNAGRRTSVALEDIDNDGFYEIIIGNDSGGLMAFNTTFKKEGALSTQENEISSFAIIPNPTSQFIKVNVDEIEGQQFSILNIDGKEVIRDMSQKLTSGFDVASLPAGIYILSLENANGVKFEKFVKY